jgi:hypothetical protein
LAAVLEVETKALTGEGAAAAEAAGTVGVVQARRTARAVGSTTSRLVGASGYAQVRIVNSARRGAPPWAARRVRLAEHSADLLSSAVIGAHLVLDAPAVSIGFAAAAKRATTARTQLEAIGYAAERLSVTDVRGWDALRVVRSRSQPARGLARGQAHESVAVTIVAGWALEVVCAAERAAVPVDVSLAAREAAEAGIAIAIVVAVHTMPAMLAGLSRKGIGFAEGDRGAVCVNSLSSASADADAMTVHPTRHDASTVDAVSLRGRVCALIIRAAGLDGRRWWPVGGRFSVCFHVLRGRIRGGLVVKAIVSPTPVVRCNRAAHTVTAIVVRLALRATAVLDAALFRSALVLQADRLTRAVDQNARTVGLRTRGERAGHTYRYRGETPRDPRPVQV